MLTRNIAYPRRRSPMDQFFIIFQSFYEAYFFFQECNPGQKPMLVVFEILAPCDTQYK